MVVSSIKPIRKSIAAYENYIFGEAHNDRKERNLLVLGAGNCEAINPKDMSTILKYERDAFPSKKRKKDAYTLVISFSDELNPNDPIDCQKAGKIAHEIVVKAYPNRSAMLCVQRDGKSGLLHAHVLLNNVDDKGKALRQNGWKHLKNVTDEVAKKNGLTPLTNKRENNSHYDWRRDLAYKIRETAGDTSLLAEMGITFKKRKSKKYPPFVSSFAFTDKEGKKRNIRGRQLASQLDLPSDYFDIRNLQQLQAKQLVKSKTTVSELDLEDLSEQSKYLFKRRDQELTL